MARTTRSSTAQQQTKDRDSPLHPSKISKKRKRIPGQDSEDQPASKSSRTDSPESFDGEQLDRAETQSPPLTLPSTADIPINAVDAAKILDILKVSDSQGLLDRQFPLSDSENVSLRQLLSEPSKHSLHTLKNAIKHLLPISAQPRSCRPYAGDHQLAFCQLALTLVDQVSCRLIDPSVDLSQLFLEDASATHHAHTSLHKPKYALMQSLPTGIWWTSANSDLVPPSAQIPSLVHLSTGHADLVAIVPTPLPSSTPPPSLASYHPPLPVHSTLNKWIQGGRRYTSGSFIDYGPYASFAPTFDSKGREIGRGQLAECIWSREKRKRERERQGALPALEVVESAPMEVVQEPTKPVSATEALQDLLPADQIESLQSVLDSLALEDTVDQLLDKNMWALGRLEELQYSRLTQKEAKVAEGSEEWETAQAIAQSLENLTLLRPRSSKCPDDAPLVPESAALRNLQKLVPLEASSGWVGTLPPTNPSAIIDDSTLKAQASAAPTVASATATPTTANPSSFGYPYAGGYNQPYRQGTTYTPYKPNQTSGYYPNAYANSTAPKSAQGYYGNTSGTSTPTQPSYYPSWFTYASNGNQSPATQVPYGASYAGAAQTPQRTPAPVANTVKSYGLPIKSGYYSGAK